jgi:ABC-type uncharacterized transport system involved in gliding motility auxiliary subunit
MKNNKLMNILLISGMALLVLSAASAMVMGRFNTATIVMAVLGICAAAAYAANNRDTVKRVLTDRSTRYGATAVVYSAIVIGILIFLQVILTIHSKQWDLTKTRRNTLSEQSVKVLKNLKANIKAYYFYSAKAPVAGLEDTLGLYEKQASKFKYEAVDTDRNPAVASKFGVERYGVVVLYREDNKSQEKVDTLSEEGITNGLIRITRDSKRKIYFTRGHGEPSLDAPRNEKTGYSVLKEELVSYNYEVADIELFSQPEVPKDCSVLVVAGPQADLFEPEIKGIEAYTQRGGKVLVFEGPMVKLPKLDGFLRTRGIYPQNDIVIDKTGGMYGGDPLMPIISVYGDHAITEPLKTASFMPDTRTFEIQQKFSGGAARELAKTGQGSWGETDLNSVKQGSVTQGPGDLKGPLTVAAISYTDNDTYAGAKPGSNVMSELVVFGSSDFANNTFIGTEANKDFILNAFNFLAGQGDTISISPKDTSFEPLFLSKLQGRMLLFIPVVFIPLIFAALGVMIFLRRRKS